VCDIYCMVRKHWKLWAVIATVTFMSCVLSSYLHTDRICSRVTKHVFAGKNFYIKRDDENSIKGIRVSISGNKSRKLLCLSRKRPFPTIVASYGGSQSNSMLAIAKIVAAASTRSTFFYFLRPLPKFLKSSPNGNLKAALDLGMQVTSPTR
jgi:1-aminocyclopropane-1-carboxylate deaminase/D-cysteine desulfhydrase-like pyridoxal-dependent ACC family enzyme